MKNRDDVLSVEKTAYAITDAARRVGATIQTLLLYEKYGLVAPARVSRTRMYREADIRLLRCIREMVHREKISLPAVKKLLQYAPCFEIRRCPEHLRRDCPASNLQALSLPTPGTAQRGRTLALCAASPDQEEGL